MRTLILDETGVAKGEHSPISNKSLVNGCLSVPLATLPSRASLYAPPPTVRKGKNGVHMKNYVHKIMKYKNSSDATFSMYSPFTCRLPPSWRDHEVNVLFSACSFNDFFLTTLNLGNLLWHC